jgi:hypothetical protein
MAIDIGRREFISVLGGTAAALPLVTRAQQPSMPVIGFLNTQSSVGSTQLMAGFLKGLRQTGFVKGENCRLMQSHQHSSALDHDHAAQICVAGIPSLHSVWT